MSKTAIFLGLLGAVLATGPAGADAIIKQVGGSGGAQYTARCPNDQLLGGLEYRAGDDYDAGHAICVGAIAPDQATTTPDLTPQPGLEDGQLPAGWFGHAGGQMGNLLCSPDAPIVLGLHVRAEGAHTVLVKQIDVYCGLATDVQDFPAYPSASFASLSLEVSHDIGAPFAGKAEGDSFCPAGLVGVGLIGRAGEGLDSIGLICGKPQVMNITKIGGAIKPQPKPEPSPASKVTAPPPKMPPKVSAHDKVTMPPPKVTLPPSKGRSKIDQKLPPLPSRVRSISGHCPGPLSQRCSQPAVILFDTDGAPGAWFADVQAPPSHCSPVEYTLTGPDGVARSSGPLGPGEHARIKVSGSLPEGSEALRIDVTGLPGGCNAGYLTGWGLNISLSR